MQTWDCCSVHFVYLCLSLSNKSKLNKIKLNLLKAGVAIANYTATQKLGKGKNDPMSPLQILFEKLEANCLIFFATSQFCSTSCKPSSQNFNVLY